MREAAALHGPARRLLFAFVLGIGAFWLSLLGYFAVESLGVPDIKFGERHWTAVYCFGIVGPLEEGASPPKAIDVRSPR